MMAEGKNNSFVSILLVALIAVVGFAVFSNQNSSPVMREMMEQQAATVSALQRIEKGGLGAGGPVDLSAVLLTQQDLQKRITSLETKLELILSAGPGGQKGSPRQRPQEDLSKVYDIAVAHSPVRGKKDAPVTIVEFVDFQCPFCARFHPPIAEVLSNYPDKVNYMIKNFPLSFHPEAAPASKAAFAAGEQGKYFEMTDLILKDNSNLSQDRFIELAKQLKLNVKKFQQDLKKNDAKYQGWIDADMKLGSEVSVRGTPTFYINGKKTTARSFPQYKAEIEKILSN